MVTSTVFSPRRAVTAWCATLAFCLLAGLPSCAPAVAPAEFAEGAAGEELVVLVHGLGRSELSMLPLARTLERDGYRVLNWGYSSTCCSVPELGARLAAELRAFDSQPPESIHFVGHSLGNIIIRWVLTNEAVEAPGRVVMLAPPNQGSHTADLYTEWFGWLLAPLDDLTTDEEATARDLPPVTGHQIGIIAGEFDGKVSIEETHLEEAVDHLVVPAAHTFIMNRPDVHRLTRSFLRNGRFTVEAAAATTAPDGEGSSMTY